MSIMSILHDQNESRKANLERRKVWPLWKKMALWIVCVVFPIAALIYVAIADRWFF